MYLASFEREPYRRGVAEGKKEAALRIASASMKKGIEPEIVSQCTGLSLDKIKQLVPPAT